jgi:hypothetical protein
MSYFKPKYKIYSALLSQNTPVASQTSGVFVVGQIWTITTYAAGDDFSNMELISGTMNTTGAVIRALETTPTVWSNGSDLSYDGAPYIVSTDANGDLNPFENTIGDAVWSYDSTGSFYLTITGAFTLNKTSVKFGSEFNDSAANYCFIVSPSTANTVNSIYMYVYDDTSSLTNEILMNTSIEIKVYY